MLRESSVTLAPEGVGEVERIEQECRYHAVMDLCLTALSSGGATGSAGALDLTGVSVGSLASAIDASRMLAATTPRALHVSALQAGPPA